MNYLDVQDAIYNWLSAELAPSTVMFADQDAPQPAVRPYATIKVLNVNRIGNNDIQGAPDGTGIATIKGHREATVSIQTFGPGAIQLLVDAQDSLNKWSVQQALRESGNIVFVSDEGIVNVSDLLETEIEERAALDMIFRYATESTDDVGFIQFVELENEIDDNNGDPGNGVIIELDSL